MAKKNQPVYKTVKCSHCKGTGKIQEEVNMMWVTKKCPACGGSGNVTIQTV